MVVDLFNQVLETPQTLPEPVIKANRMFVENVEKLLIFQMNSIKTCFDISINQLRAAAEITDLQSLQDFYIRQAEIAQTLQRKLMNDARILSGMVARFQTEMGGPNQTLLAEPLAKAA
jgi:phasin family protein